MSKIGELSHVPKTYFYCSQAVHVY